MDDNCGPRFSFPAICSKKGTAAFDGGRLTSDGGVLLLVRISTIPRRDTDLIPRMVPIRCRARRGAVIDVIYIHMVIQADTPGTPLGMDVRLGRYGTFAIRGSILPRLS